MCRYENFIQKRQDFLAPSSDAKSSTIFQLYSRAYRITLHNTLRPSSFFYVRFLFQCISTVMMSQQMWKINLWRILLVSLNEVIFIPVFLFLCVFGTMQLHPSFFYKYYTNYHETHKYLKMCSIFGCRWWSLDYQSQTEFKFSSTAI